MRSITLLTAFTCTVLLTLVGYAEPRQVIDLSGMWQITEGSMNEVPTEFQHKVPVPGLVDLATPSFDAVGAVPKDPRDRGTRPTDTRRQAFWYRTTFAIKGSVPSIAQLKLYKAKFGTHVLLNGQLIGDHAPNFTPAYCNVRSALLRLLSLVTRFVLVLEPIRLEPLVNGAVLGCAVTSQAN